jgi:hypothetical protein
MTDKSRVASGKAGAENAARKREKAKPTREERARASEVKKEAATEAQRSARREAAGARQQARDLNSKDPGTRRRAFDAQVAAAKPSGVVDAKRQRELNQERKARNAAIKTQVAAAAQREKAAVKAATNPVKPVIPPPASVERRPISDPVRLRAESSKMDEAFSKAPGARDNHVSLASLRATMPHLSKEEFVAVVNKGRDEGKYSLDSFEGRVRPMTVAEREAAIVESGTPLVWISRREGGGSAPPAPAREQSNAVRRQVASRAARKQERGAEATGRT